MKDYKKSEPLVVTSVRIPRSLLKRAKKLKINISLVVRDALEKATAQEACVCGEINARNCPVHQK